MSCDGNRHKYFEQLAQRADVRRALGLSEPAETAMALERLYQLAQSAGVAASKGGGEREVTVETELTRALFNRMRAMGIKPPTHSADGLPKTAARFGYGQIERLLRAVDNGGQIPRMAVSISRKVAADACRRPILQQTMQGQQNALSAVGFDAKGYYRCANCGRFASQKYGHVCPRTATSADLSRMLQRRLGLPESAFQGYNIDALGNLLEQARERGTVTMIHALTGATQEVTLDGIPQAMMAGYMPVEWNGTAVPVITDDLRVVNVLNADGLTMAAEDIGAVHALAQYYGITIPPDAPVMNAYRAISTGSPLHQVSTQADVPLEGGQEYDLGHFIGTEFRKGDARGTFVEVGGRRYAVYARSRNPADRSIARGRFAAVPDDVVVGRTLPAAIGILAESGVSEANGKIEVYDKNEQLLAVYDPSTNTAGDTRGNTNASAEQMAAVLAYRMLYPSSAFDYALIHDFGQFKQGTGSPLAAADSAYLTLRSMLESGATLQLGATLGAGRCPRCGQFIGQGAHFCPADQRPAEVPVPPVPVELPEVVLDAPNGLHDLPAIPPAAPPVQVQVSMPENFASELASAVAGLLSARPLAENSPQPHLEAVLGQLAAILAAQQEILQRLVQQQQQQPLPAPAASASVLDAEKFGETVARIVAQSIPAAAQAPVVVTGDGTVAARPRRCPRCGQFMDENHQCPPRQERKGQQTRPADAPPCEVEKILDGIVMAAPDLYLDQVPEEWGGKRATPLPENVPEWKSDEEYEMGQQERTIYNLIALQLRKKSKRPTNRAFGLYGPAGTGKNTIARMLAANLKCDDGKQGLPYYEINITPDMDIAQAIGEVVLTTDENGNTVSRVRLGPIGQCAASGGVVAINEIVRAPKLATALQSIIEDGEISIPTPEGGTYKVPVHPSAIFVSTWNPGYEGDADRPAQAFLSRILALPLSYPSKEEQIRRIQAHFESEGLEMPKQEILDAAVGFWNDVRLLTGGTGQSPQVGAYSPTRTTPGPRELARFVEIGTRSNWENALLSLEIICDQDAEYRQAQVAALHDRFEAHFAGLI